jgi:hypothetical protein
MSISAIQSSGTKPATIGVNGNGYIVASFSDNQDKEIQFNIQVPNDCDTSENVNLCLGWSSPVSNTALKAKWTVTYLVTAENESTEQAGAPVTLLVSPSSTADGIVLTPLGDITLTGQSVCIHFKVERTGSDLTDTLGGIAEVHGVALRYTANKLGLVL